MSYKSVAEERPDRYKVVVAQYVQYQTQGFLVVPGLVSAGEVESLITHGMDLLHGKVPVPGMEPPPLDATEEQLINRFTRVHQLHRHDLPSERFLLHPRVLDVLEALIGPDVLSLQTMLFYNAPGMGGQGWHQDAYYITTYPETLIGTWLALDRVDEENGCLWVVPGSNHEPIYPDAGRGSLIHTEGAFADLGIVEETSNMDDQVNTLARIVGKYPPPMPVPVEPGDVVFFHSHLLHRSHPNRSGSRWRRAFVSHYCNARSWVPWNHGAPYEGEAANYQHILARGATHLPFAQPRFGTPCAALACADEPRPTDPPATAQVHVA
ncbi:MAG: phytanoyl-CoA dioxygenase family protein [Candidatus Handelsmanbacteria bacterium]|nr:phytanoyl-CoA dioxygenase family protein [Candidatus Handelsmanbacteria bacterium]